MKTCSPSSKGSGQTRPLSKEQACPFTPYQAAISRATWSRKAPGRRGPRVHHSSRQAHLALLSTDDYYQLTGARREVSLLEAMDAIPGGEGIEFEPPQLSGHDLKVPDFGNEAKGKRGPSDRT